MAGGVEYQVTKVDPTDPETKGMVYQVHKVTEEVAATLGGKVYRARIIKDPTDPAVAGKVYQIVLIDDPDDPSVKGMVYNAILTGGSEAVVVGPAVSPLSLPDAVAGDLDYVKAFGGTEQRNLPSGYTQLEYIESNGTQYIDLDVSGDATFIGTAQSTTDSPTASQVLVANFGASAGHWFGVQSPGAGSSFAKRWGLGAIAIASSTIDGTTKVDFEITFTQSSQYGTVNDQVLNRESSTSAHTNWIIFAGTTTSSYGFIGKVWGLKVVQNDVLVRNLIPAKNSSNIVGMYDIVNDVFYENAGSGTFTAGPTAVPTLDAPMDIVSNNGVLKVNSQGQIYTDGTVETINVHGKNLIDNDACRRYDEEDDVPTTNCYGWLITLPAGTYTISQGAGNNSYVRHSADNGSTWSSFATISENVSRTYTFDTETLMYVYGTASDRRETQKAKKVQIELGSTATEYAPYYDGGTSTAEMLLKVGDYQDEQEILSGVVTRNVGILVFDGTEDWNPSGSVNGMFYLSDSGATFALPNTCICSHFSGCSSTITSANMPDMSARCGYVGYTHSVYMKNIAFGLNLATWKAFLAAQYAAGTPVIVIYPLATPTTESVAGQTLQVTGGDNVLEITQASLTGLELEAEYEKEGA